MGTYYPSHNYGPEHAASLRDGTYADFSEKPKRPLSEKQLEANRRNAQRSTGPRTYEGKARSSRNAFRSGITGQVSVNTDEDRAAHAAFTTSLIANLKPEGAVEDQLALSIAESHWRLNRARAMEDNMFALGDYGPAASIDADDPELQSALTSAQVFLDSSRAFERLTLYEQRIQRSLEKNMAQLKELQAERKAERDAALDEAVESGEPHANGFEFSSGEIDARRARNARQNEAQTPRRKPFSPVEVRKRNLPN